MRIVIGGDFVPNNRIEALCAQHQYEEVMGEMKIICQDYDFRIVNMECPVYSGNHAPIIKTGLAIKCNKTVVEMLKYVGIDCVTLANNHFYDYGDAGVKETIDTLDTHAISHVGGGSNLHEASETLYVPIGKETLAIVNCTEHEFSIATKHSGGSNPLNPISQYHAITQARKQADYVLVIAHGGIETYNKPTPRMQETFRFFIDVGADAVVNHHQHCPSGYEVYAGKPIFYGIGNLCFDYPHYRNHPWNKGYLAGITFCKDKISSQIHPYIQCDVHPDIEFLKGENLDHFMAEIEQVNEIIANPQKLEEELEKFMDETIGREEYIFTPYRTKIGNALREKKLLPFFFPKSKWPLILNRIECESHRDRLIHFVRKKMQ